MNARRKRGKLPAICQGRNRLRLLALVPALMLLPVVRAIGAPVQSANARSTQSDAPRVVVDGTGRRVKIPARVGRIVSLAPNLTETLYALGLGDRLVGDTTYCDVPEDAKTKPHVGAPVNPSVEAIIALRPNMVFATTSINRVETVDALEHLGIPVYTTNSQTVREMIDSVGQIADVTDAAAVGAALTASLNARLDALRKRLAGEPPVRAVFVVWLDPLQSVGQHTFIADAMRWAGAESVVTSNQNWPQLSFEEVVRLQPEYFVFASSHSGEGAVTVEDLQKRPVWKDLRAVRDGHVAIVSDEIDRPDPGLIGAIEELARDLHPKAFKASAKDRMRSLPASRESICLTNRCATLGDQELTVAGWFGWYHNAFQSENGAGGLRGAAR
ncbi:MAG TPA: helical backbone metal receptor [Candidatus Acidoferrum sp.]|nr:helical backbone metal receptor [Candidatus Acidoferrum sp.]